MKFPNLPYFTFPHKMESIKSRLRTHGKIKRINMRKPYELENQSYYEKCL